MLFYRMAAVVTLCLMMVAGLALPSLDAVSAEGLSAGGGAVVNTEELNLRGGPGAGNPIVSVLSSGTNLRLLAGPVNERWWRVTDGKSVGYVNGDWLAPASPPDGSAAFDLDLPIPFHRQMTAVWCDPADLQSWTEYVQEQSLGGSVAIQQSIWDWELSHNAGFTEDQWNASPYAVASAAHHWMPDRGYNHFIYDDPVAATNTVAWLLANPQYREPSVALIWDAEHYVLVRGIRATADPYLDPQAEILGVYIMDPNQGGSSWLGEDRYIPISSWVSRFLTPVSYLTPASGVPGDVWQGKLITIQRDWTSEGPSLSGRVNASPRSYLTASR